MKKNVLKYCLLFVGLIMFYMCSLTLLSSFMTERIKTNIKTSSVTLSNEGNWPERQILYRGYGLSFDNYTDAVALSTIWSVNTQKPFRSAMLMPHDGMKAKRERPGELESSDAVGDLAKTIEGETYGTEYARYWHGYILWLKPLLLITDLSGIRVMLTIVLILLLLILLGGMIKDGYRTHAVILGLGLMCGDYLYMGTSLQGVSVFLITMIASILLWYKKKNISGLVFFISGSLIAFMDLLTVPLLGLTIPLVVYQIKERDTVKTFIKHTILWCVGFGLTWASKWVLTDVFFHRRILKTAFTQMMWRTTGEGDVTFNMTLVICLLFVRSFLLPAIIAIIILTIAIVVERKVVKANFKNSYLYLILAISPFIWYIIFKTHSFYHAYFAYRNLVTFFVGTFLFLYSLLERKSDGSKRVNNRHSRAKRESIDDDNDNK